MRRIHRYFVEFDYQLDRHCSKTAGKEAMKMDVFDYQLDRHCSKTTLNTGRATRKFDYQLDRHCSKTLPR